MAIATVCTGGTFTMKYLYLASFPPVTFKITVIAFSNSNYSIVFVAAVTKSSELRAKKAQPAAAGAKKKRQGDYGSSSNESNANRVDQDNPLEMVFYTEKKRKPNDLMADAKVEHKNYFESVDMERSYDALFEILWYTRIPCFDENYRQCDFNPAARKWKYQILYLERCHNALLQTVHSATNR